MFPEVAKPAHIIKKCFQKSELPIDKLDKKLQRPFQEDGWSCAN